MDSFVGSIPNQVQRWCPIKGVHSSLGTSIFNPREEEGQGKSSC